MTLSSQSRVSCSRTSALITDPYRLQKFRSDFSKMVGSYILSLPRIMSCSTTARDAPSRLATSALALFALEEEFDAAAPLSVSGAFGRASTVTSPR